MNDEVINVTHRIPRVDPFTQDFFVSGDVPGDVQFNWTEADIQTLHVRLLQESLRAIPDKRNSKETVEEILGWVMSNNDAPFSFRRCLDVMASECNVGHLDYDPEAIRSEVVRLSKQRRLYDETKGSTPDSDFRKNNREMAGNLFGVGA